MYIKQLIIQGFKSYKDQTVMEPFSSGTNVIVGRNGSGKSNFFAAIRFVLGDAYTLLSREERQALLHEGSGSAVMSAYVEIIFDNSDNRFQTGNKEVSLRRTITLKKDEYAVDKKVSNRQEVMSMLDTAGFSLKNSYYIVPQGRVTALTNMKESDRLKLLKEVAGTESYEARRTESLKIMTETNNKREKIDELLDYIKNRMNELEEEKEELRGFQEKDRERRCLEYAYYHQQQVSFNDSLEEIEQARLGSSTATDENEKAAHESQQILSQLEAKLAELNQSLDILKIEQRDHEQDRKEISKVQANAELKVKNLSDTHAAREQTRLQNEEDLHNVKKDLELKEKQLAQAIPDYDKRKAKEAKVKQAFDAAEVARRRLLSKQARGSQFRNKAERDEVISADIAEINLTIQTLKANHVAADEAVGDATQTIQELEAELSSTREELKGYSGNRDALAEQLNQAKDETQKLDDERKLLHREQDKLQSVIQVARRERDKAQHDLGRVMDPAVARGIASIEALKQKEDIPGAYGILADLMDVSKVYHVPVEQIAGNSLFHYVVDSDQTGTLLVDHLHKTYGGRLTIMPLEQLRPRPVKLPTADDAMPLLSKIKHDAKYDKAFQQVFGKVVLCPSLAVASQYARSHNVTGITTDGDITNKGGAVSGGYVDRSRSRLDILQTRNKWRAEYEQLLQQADDIRSQQERKEQQITGARGQERRLEIQLRQFEEGYEPLRLEHSRKTEQLELERDRLDAAQRRREKLNADMQEQITSVDSFEAEKKSDFKKALTATEEQQLQQLGKQVAELQKQLVDASNRRREVENLKITLEGELRNLRKTEDQLASSNFEPASLSGSGGSYADAQKELKRIRKASDSITKKLQKAEADIDETTAKMTDIEAQVTVQENALQELSRAKEKHEKRMEKSRRQIGVLQQQLGECAKSIRDLGVLPDEAFDKYERMDTGKISKRLKTVNEALKKFKHVNKKAFEQYNNFTTQQEQLLKRRKELDASQESIEELVAHLDRVKDESIERTFKQISKEFATIFERLVPAGHGRLVIQRRSDPRGQEEDDEEQRRSVENYTGVGISVSFNSKGMDEQQKVQQLSGGQKSLCALCLIFAIQQTDPSPMVVFDEVDANLDAQYRTAVAGLLESISTDAGTQFICTTFRPEIVRVADKCYGVTFTNKTSSIDCVPTEEALNFVEGQKQ